VRKRTYIFAVLNRLSTKPRRLIASWMYIFVCCLPRHRLLPANSICARRYSLRCSLDREICGCRGLCSRRSDTGALSPERSECTKSLYWLSYRQLPFLSTFVKPNSGKSSRDGVTRLPHRQRWAKERCRLQATRWKQLNVKWNEVRPGEEEWWEMNWSEVEWGEVKRS
jgi:hypothetical protein